MSVKMMDSPRVNKSVPKFNMLKKSRLVNNATSPLPSSEQKAKVAKGMFRQWGEPHPPPSSRSRTCERTQNTFVKKRPRSADPRFRRRIAKSESASAVDKTKIDDHTEMSKSENGTPRTMCTDGEINTNNLPPSLTSSRPSICDRIQTTTPMKRPGSADTRLRRRIDKSESASSVDRSKIGDHKEQPKSEYGTSKKMCTAGEINTNNRPPLTSLRPRTCERTQNTTPMKRPGSADPRLRRRIDKSESASTIDRSKIGDHKEQPKLEHGTPRKIYVDGEININNLDESKIVLEILDKSKNILGKNPESTLCFRKENFVENAGHETQKCEEPASVVTTLHSEGSPRMRYVFNEEKQVSKHVLEKENTGSFQDDSLESRFHDHTFYSTLQQKYIPYHQNDKLTVPAIEDNIYEIFLKERIKLCTSQSVMSIPIYADSTICLKDNEENVSSLAFGVKPSARRKDVYLVLGSAFAFSLVTWLIIRLFMDASDLLHCIPWFKPEPEPTMIEQIASITEFIIESCISVGGFVFRVFTITAAETLI